MQVQSRPLREGFVDALPFALSTAILGVAFGAGAVAVGLSPLAATLTSTLVYSGTGQFAALPLWTGSVLLLTLSILVLSLRFALMTTSIAPQLASRPRWVRAAVAFCVTDENYALAVSRRGGKVEPEYIVGTWLVLFGFWVLGTAIGALIGARVPPEWQAPLEAVFPIVFLVVIVLVCTNRPAAMVAVLGGLLGVVGALTLPSGWSVVAAGLLASLAGPLLERWTGDGS